MHNLDQPIGMAGQCGKGPVHGGRVQDHQCLVPGIPECSSNRSQQAVSTVKERGIVFDEDDRMAASFKAVSSWSAVNGLRISKFDEVRLIRERMRE